jgi:hypothetical protein
VEHDLGQRDMGVGEGALLLFRHSREAQRAAVGRRGLLGSAGLLVFASSFGMAVLAGPAAADSGLSSSFPVWLLFAAFLVADRAVVPIYPIRGTRSQISFSLTEMPLVFALLIASPVTALAARVVAGLMVMLREGRRDPAKFAFNLSAFALDTGAPLFAYHVVLGGPPLTGPWGWAAAFVAVQSGAVLSALLIQGAIFLSDGPYPVRHLRKVLGLGMLAAAVNTALGLVAVVLLLSRPSTIFLLLPVAGLAFVAYRGYSRLSARHEMMTLLHGFTQRVGQPLERGATSERLLHEAAELMRAEFAELVLVQAGDDVRTVERVRAGPCARGRARRQMTRSMVGCWTEAERSSCSAGRECLRRRRSSSTGGSPTRSLWPSPVRTGSSESCASGSGWGCSPPSMPTISASRRPSRTTRARCWRTAASSSACGRSSP